MLLCVSKSTIKSSEAIDSHGESVSSDPVLDKFILFERLSEAGDSNAFVMRRGGVLWALRTESLNVGVSVV